MKKVLLCVTALGVGFGLQADVLTAEQALERARALNPEQMVRKAPSSTSKMEVKTIMAADKPAVYLFANDGANGTLVLSADDCTQPVLGYADRAVDPDNLPPAFVYMLESYADEIEWMRAHGVSGGEIRLAAPQRAAIAPMCKTQWNQSTPFNNDCPEYNGSKCVTGCVATAMAQVMKYYQYPATGEGSHSYTTPSLKIAQSMDFSKVTFDWANMIDSYNGTYTDAQAQAVATLMHACGVSCDMDYSPSSSGAQTNKMAQAFMNYFKYGKSVEYIMRDYYSIDGWNDAIYTNLRDFGPVLLGGSNDGGGHQFVCDGYDGKGYFHINWGWGGVSDGYYSLSALTPGQQGIGGSSDGYTSGQDAVLHLVPDASDNSQTLTVNADGFTLSVESANLGSSIRSGGRVENGSLFPISGQFLLKFTAADGTVTYSPSGMATTDLGVGYGYSSGFSAYIPADLAAGTYTVTPAFRDNDGNYYDIHVKTGQIQYYTGVVADGKITFTAAGTPTLTSSEISFPATIYLNTPFQVSETITNQGPGDYIGTVMWYIGKVDNGQFTPYGRANYFPVSLTEGESQEFSSVATMMPFTSHQSDFVAGSYYVCLVTGDGQILYQAVYPVTVEATPKTGTLTCTSLVINNSTSVDPNRFSGTATLKVSGGVFNGSVTGYIFPYVPGQSVTSVASYTLPFVSLTDGESRTVSFNTSVPLTLNTQYFTELLYNNSWISSQVAFKTETVSGVESVAVDESAEVVGTQYYTLTGVAVQGIPTQPGLYIKVERMADGNTVSKREVVR